jgi:hypothetical protein
VIVNDPGNCHQAYARELCHISDCRPTSLVLRHGPTQHISRLSGSVAIPPVTSIGQISVKLMVTIPRTRKQRAASWFAREIAVATFFLRDMGLRVHDVGLAGFLMNGNDSHLRFS